MANGTAWREQNFVRVEWAWMAAPITLALLSLIFVAITIAQSAIPSNKYKIWKSSSLPPLLVLSDELRLDVGGLQSLSENENALKHARALLGRNSDGEWTLQGPPK